MENKQKLFSISLTFIGSSVHRVQNEKKVFIRWVIYVYEFTGAKKEKLIFRLLLHSSTLDIQNENQNEHKTSLTIRESNQRVTF